MTDPWTSAAPTLAVAFMVGVLLGVFFFGGLWWTVSRGLRSDHAALLFLGSLVVRSAVVVGGFLLVSGGLWPRLLACAAGFAAARVAVTRLTRTQEVSGAP